jgi:hypothetical protein
MMLKKMSLTASQTGAFGDEPINDRTWFSTSKLSVYSLCLCFVLSPNQESDQDEINIRLSDELDNRHFILRIIFN